MAANIITQEDLEQFRIELMTELKELFQSNFNQPSTSVQSLDLLLKSHQIQKMLKISPGTLQNLRINGTIPYSKIGGVILYPREEIEQLIKKNMRNTR